MATFNTQHANIQHATCEHGSSILLCGLSQALPDQHCHVRHCPTNIPKSGFARPTFPSQAFPSQALPDQHSQVRLCPTNIPKSGIALFLGHCFHYLKNKK